MLGRMSIVTRGHLRAVAQLEQAAGYRETRALYAAAVPHGVYLRPTDRGFTVLSLDWERCGSMIGVGGREDRDHELRELPPDAEHVSKAVAGYDAKRSSLARHCVEEHCAARAIARAFERDLELPEPGLCFVHQEWRLPGRVRIDILGVDLTTRRWVIVELKRSAAEATRTSARKGGDAAAQARAYTLALQEHRAELYPYFQRVARALARHHDGPPAMRALEVDPDHVPETLVAWPGRGRW